MDRRNYIIISLLVITWLIEDIYHLAPLNHKIAPFFFSVREIKIRAYIYDITSHLQYMSYLVCLFISRGKLHSLTKDVVIMTFILKFLSLYWYMSKYGNPHYHSEWILVSISAVVIFICLEFYKFNGNHVSNISN